MKAMVTGGGGFLGSHLVKALLARGDSVRVLARGDYPELRALGAETIRGDITDAAATAKACEGIDVVFHTAAKAGGWGDPKEYEAINVTGTDHVVAGCRAGKVPVLIHTSSPSVVHGHEDIEGANESIPYAKDFTAHYPRTKAISEQRALAASDASLKVIALRPHFIWGPGDRHLLPRLVARAKTGRLRQIGSRDPKCDTIYIDNCVDAHLLAAEALRGGAPLGGKVYFVSDDAPIGVWTMANKMLACAGLGPVGRPIPAGLAYGVGATMELVYALFGVEKEPLITRFGASELSYAQWFDISAAKRDLGYQPKVTIDEGLRRLAASLAPKA
ncbi:MAG: NAD-dependent epimerase/dehydratase family protein [Myxococcaceae bacterium]|jgi:nucleoside-diphosphate-sugar epimerase|nr:NAD-dependent epimerase/dehydratase family protein [Myxococcaceae bacterium]